MCPRLAFFPNISDSIKARKIYYFKPPNPICFPCGSAGQESTCNARNLGSIPGLGRSPGEGNSYPLQYSCLENSKDKGAWWAKVHGVTKSWTRLSTAQHHPYNLSLLIASFVEIELQYGLFLSFFICKYYATFFWLSSLILNTHFWDTHALNFDFSSLLIWFSP